MSPRLVLILALLVAPMARAQTAITVQTLPTEFTGAQAITLTAAAASMTFQNDGRTFLWVGNSGTSSITVTVVAVGPSDQGFTQNATYTVAAGKLGVIEALSVRRFNNRATGKVTINLSATSAISVAAVRMPHARH